MNAPEDAALLARLVQHAADGTSDTGPAQTVSPRRYLDPERFEAERALFRRRPVVLGAASRVAEPGAFFTHDATGVPLLVVRGRDGVLRAFLNACRHRGTRLVDVPAGERSGFVCPYHGWSYDDRGALRGIPGPERFPQVDPARCHLLQVPVAAWAGLVWAVASPDAAAPDAAPLDPRAIWGEAARAIEALQLDGYVGYAERQLEVAANWKLALDASLENYHVQVAHRDTIASMFLRDTMLADRFPGAIRTVFPKRSVAALQGDPAGHRLRDHANLIWWLMPGALLLVEPDHVQAMIVFPVAIDRLRIEGVTLIPEAPQTDKARRHWDRNVAIFWEAIEEDFAMMARMQRGLGQLPALHFGTTEHTSAWVHEELDRATDAQRAQRD